MDHAEVRGSKPIDTITASYRIIEYVEGSQLLKYGEIIFTDHQAYIININLEDYFIDQLSSWDEINRVMLNPSRQSHRNKFVESVDYQLQHLNLKNMIMSIMNFLSNE